MTNTYKYAVRMQIIDKIPVVAVSGVRGFDVTKTFDCGQCFRFEPVENSRHEQEFAGVACGKMISMAQDGDTVYIYNSDESDFYNIWQSYLGLDVDYERICEDITS
ncbi:MAG: 8-oxoguanine DNA glycosylase, N-terminal domain-containing protein, partial [Clostridia bacterium]|nr:8-oxoguanine DNA glycosylase, N-terminal domain-containing protein [Clostridia bacterium]